MSLMLLGTLAVLGAGAWACLRADEKCVERSRREYEAKKAKLTENWGVKENHGDIE